MDKIYRNLVNCCYLSRNYCDSFQTNMDRLPLVPRNEDHDVLYVFRDVFQDVLRVPEYPKNVAGNYENYQIDLEFRNAQKTGLDTIKVLQTLDASRDNITSVEREILTSHAQAIVNKNDCAPFLEEIKLKRFGLFTKLSNESYELIQKSDFFPNFVQQRLDFTYNPQLHKCKACKEPQIQFLPVKKLTKNVQRKNPLDPPPQVVPSFEAEPKCIVFYNYELNKVYREKFKLRNITKTSQSFQFRNFPKSSVFHLQMISDSCKLAPGMFAEFVVSFHPEMYQNRYEIITFKTSTGVDVTLDVIVSRDSPKLVCYVLNPFFPSKSVKKAALGSRFFVEQRQNSINFTIDCGTCFLGSYSIMSVIMKNEGSKGKFFITSEQEWVFGELEDNAVRQVELHHGCFHVFPTFFELEEKEMGELCVVFVPEKLGVFTEKVFMICDNNCHQELQLLGNSISFRSSFLRVNMFLVEDTFSYKKHALELSLTPFERYTLLFTITNDSPVYLEYYWILAADNKEESYKRMDTDWISVDCTEFLPPFSDTDVMIQLTPKTNDEGTYYIYLSLCVKNIPIESVKPGTFLTYGPDDKLAFLPFTVPKETDNLLPKLVNVRIFELRIFCNVKKPLVPFSTTERQENVEPEDLSDPRTIMLSKTFLNFGHIPKGVEISKSFFVRNLTENEIDWKIVEVFRKNSDIFLLLLPNYLNRASGTLKGYEKKKLVYSIKAKECFQSLSILVLFSSSKSTGHNFIAETICVVTYEISEVKISIRMANNTTILCPNFSYVGLPTYDKIYVHNEGVLTGCFYFLKPTGANSDKIRLRFQPQSAVVPAGTTIEVVVEVVALESGIFEDIYVPCFVGDPDKLLTLIVILSAATISVHFYLPCDEGYKRVLWPANQCLDSVSCPGEDRLDEGQWDYSFSSTSHDEALGELIDGNSVAMTYPTVRMKPIYVKNCAKLTFHVENLTPISGRFLVNPINYSPEEECFSHILVKAKTRPPEVFWEKACLEGHGIVVEAEQVSGNIIDYEVIEINLWIYANTWGTYLEEMIVEINDLTPFCFNLLIEVLGIPLEFPFAKNTTLPCPTLRIGHVSYSSKTTTKAFSVINISNVPVIVSWYVFTDAPIDDTCSLNVLLEFEEDLPKITVPKTFYGYKCSKYISVTPSEMVVEKQSTVMVSVELNTNWLPPSSRKTNLKFNLIGFINLTDKDKFKENYFKRDCGADFSTAKLEMLVTLELSITQIEVSCDETTINVFVNDILLKKKKFPEVYLVLRNVQKSTVEFTLEIDQPFQICAARAVPTGILDPQNLSLASNECLQVVVTCHFSQQDLSEYADILYQDKGQEDYISVITRDLSVYQEGIYRQVLLHFPHIKVKPTLIQFQPCLLYKTRKEVISIYNMTGSVILFEVLKTTKTETIEVYPNIGELPASTGLNKQFIDIGVYFTPTRCKLHVESLRILTNICQYYVDIPISGTGTNNEKFNPD